MKFNSMLLALALTMPATSLAVEEVVVEGVSVPQKPTLSFKVPDYNLTSKTFIFPSGLRVMLQPDHSQPIVAITSYIDHGSTSDPVGKEGIAHFVEHLWFRSKHGDLPKIWDVLSELGSSLNASTADDWTNYMTVAPATSLEALLKLESLRLSDPVRSVESSVVDIEREVIRNELRMRYENSWFMAMPYLFDKLYPPGHPYQRLGIGTHESLDNIQLADIVKFTEDYYRPEKTTIMIVGDFDPNDAAQLIFRNFDPTLLHPKLTDELMHTQLKAGVKAKDVPPDVATGDPRYFEIIPLDPADPSRPLPLIAVDGRGVPNDPRFPVRVQGAPAPPPPPQDRTLSTVEVPVDRPTVIIAWTVPGGYRNNEAEINVAAGMVSNAMAGYFRRDPRVRKNPDFSYPEVGCFPWVSKIDSKVICSIELATDKANADDIADKAIDQIAGLYASDLNFTPEARVYMEQGFARSKNSAMKDTLLNLDLVSALYGRATQIAQHAHFTGSQQYHTDQIQSLAALDMQKPTQVVYEYLKRDRAVRLLLMPLDEKDRALDNSNSDWAGASGNVIDTAIDPKSVTPAVVLENLVAPDTTKVIERTLTNGIKVAVMPHGEAPVVTARIIANGGTLLEPFYLDSIAESFRTDILDGDYNPNFDPLRIAGEWSRTSTSTYSSLGITASSGNTDGALWMLSEVVGSIGLGKKAYNYNYSRLLSFKPWVAEKQSRAKRRWYNGNYWQATLADQLIPDHILSRDTDYSFWQSQASLKPAAIQSYLHAKYAPTNLTLLVVGNVDPTTVLAQAEAYFGDIKPKPTSTKIAPEVAPPTKPGAGGVYVFDAPKSTQTDVSFTCAITPDNGKNKAARELLGDLLDERAWQILREESGVTYGAGAYTRMFPGGYSTLNFSSLVQADSSAIGAKVFLDLVQEAKDDKLDEGRLALLKLVRAKKYVLGQQSSQQMAARLQSILGDPKTDWSYFGDYAKELSEVTLADIAAALGDCDKNYVMILEGQKANTGKQLTAAGIAHEVFDIEAAGDKAYAAADPKGFAKYDKKRAKAKAKADAKKAASGESESSDDTAGDAGDADDDA